MRPRSEPLVAAFVKQIEENPFGAKQNQKKANLRVKVVLLCVPICPCGEQSQPTQQEQKEEDPAHSIARVHIFALLIFLLTRAASSNSSSPSIYHIT